MGKIKIIEPFQKKDAGISCCCMLLEYYGSKHSIVELRNEIDIGRDGIIWEDIYYLLNKYHLKVNRLRIREYNDLIHRISVPFMANISNRYVVVENITKNVVYICDPLGGKYELDINIFLKISDGNILFAKPSILFKKVNRKYFFWKLYIKDIFNNRKIVYKVFFLSILSYILSIVSPMIIQKVVDNLMIGKNKEADRFTIIYLAFVIISGLILFVKGINLIEFRKSIDKNISKNAMKKILFIPYKYYESRSNSEIMYGINCCGSIREVFATQMIGGIIDFGAVFFIALYILEKNLFMGWLTIGLFILNGVYIMFANPKMLQASKKYIGEQMMLNGMQVEAINTMQSIKMSAMQEETYNMWEKGFDDFQNKYVDSQKIINRINSISSVLGSLSPFIILLISFELFKNGELTIGEALAIQTLSSTFFGLATSLFTSFWGFTQSNVYMERMSDIIMQEIENGDNKKRIQVEGNVTFKSASFSYKENGKEILSNIDLEVKKGEKLAIVGKSGSGKSTLAKLFVGLYKVTSGSIEYEGVDSNELDMSYISSQFGIISQDATLFNKSIYDNIKMNRDYVSYEDIIEASKIVGIYDEINSMPLKFQTMVSDFGENFSGGQRQRIILARAIVAKPKLLVMDEATSSLDNINEKKVIQYLKDNGSTQVIIAHRFSTIIDADAIIVLDNGNVVGYGSHEQLLNTNKYYRELYNGIDDCNDNNCEDISNKWMEDEMLLLNNTKLRKKDSKKIRYAIGVIIILAIVIIIKLSSILYNKDEHISNKVEFKDKVIQEYIEGVLNVDESDMQEEQLCLVKELIIKDKKVTSLDDLKLLPCLEKIELNNASISDISQLKNMDKLKILILKNNNISNVDCISTLKNIELIDVSDNNIKTIGNIDRLIHLSYLNIEGNDVESIGKIGSQVCVKKYKYDCDITIDYTDNLIDYSNKNVCIWNNSGYYQEQKLGYDGKVVFHMVSNEEIMSFRIDDKLLNQTGMTKYINLISKDNIYIKVSNDGNNIRIIDN